MNFENLVLGKVFYSYILDIVFGIYIVVLILYIICRYAKKELVDALHLNIKFIKFIPRILINVIIIFFVFGWNYKSRTMDFSIKDDMLVTTFLVGMLSIMDLISTLANLYHEFKESNENKIRKELDELKKRIEELENNNR